MPANNIVAIMSVCAYAFIKMKEMFGTGTAAVVTPIDRILFVDEVIIKPASLR